MFINKLKCKNIITKTIRRIFKAVQVNRNHYRRIIPYTTDNFQANVHTNYIGKVERGEQNLTVKKIVALANSLNVPVEEILNLTK
ncbi:XRE family transcriptional regulator [bacterium]|nr:XRE family transcriptional regulator [bacterium]